LWWFSSSFFRRDSKILTDSSTEEGRRRENQRNIEHRTSNIEGRMKDWLHHLGVEVVAVFFCVVFCRDSKVLADSSTKEGRRRENQRNIEHRTPNIEGRMKDWLHHLGVEVVVAFLCVISCRDSKILTDSSTKEGRRRGTQNGHETGLGWCRCALRQAGPGVPIGVLSWNSWPEHSQKAGSRQKNPPFHPRSTLQSSLFPPLHLPFVSLPSKILFF
jgi:3-dehydroquinate dehydratase